MHWLATTATLATLSLSVVVFASGEAARAQGSPLGRWQPPMKFTGTLLGCSGNQINSAPATVAYNTTFAVTFTLAGGRTLASASLLTPGSVTHSHDPNQRLVELAIVTSTASTATLSTPINPTKAPFGHYMLFLTDSAGEVSVAAWTQLL